MYGTPAALLTCSSQPHARTPVARSRKDESMEISSGDATPRSALAARGDDVRVGDVQRRAAVIRAMSTRDTLSGPPMLNVL